MADVLFVSKPVTPPWNDSNKNLVRDLCAGLQKHRARVLVTRGASAPSRNAIAEPIYGEASHYAPSRMANARVLGRLLLGARADLWHFFFGPNPLTLKVGAFAKRVRRVPCVHTIASAPSDLERVAPSLFADRVVTVSEHTRARLAAVGVDAVFIPPAISAPEVTPAAIVAVREKYALPERFALYPGDLEFGNGAQTFVDAAADRSQHWVIASRPKTPAAREARATLEAKAKANGAAITWLGEVNDIHALVAASSALALVTDSLHAKMDWPLVLLEALLLRVPIIVAKRGAAAELAPSGACATIDDGDPSALREAVRAVMDQPMTERERRAEQGSAWVRAQCGPAAVAARYEALYDGLLEENGRL